MNSFSKGNNTLDDLLKVSGCVVARKINRSGYEIGIAVGIGSSLAF